jgi:prepilin-type N-terminal cleavage/methylation domain-containing protein
MPGRALKRARPAVDTALSVRARTQSRGPGGPTSPAGRDGGRLRGALVPLLREHGFTLVEEMVALVILALLFTAFSTLITSGLNDSAQVTNDSVLQEQVRFTLDELTSELRQAFPASSTAGSEFATTSGQLSPTSLTFYTPDETFSDSTIAGQTGFHLNEVSYQLSAGNLERALATSTNTCSPSTTVTCGGTWSFPALGGAVTRVGSIVNSNIFTYYTDSNPPTQTTSPANAATVVVTLTVAPGSGQQFTYSDSATLRVPS